MYQWIDMSHVTLEEHNREQLLKAHLVIDQAAQRAANSANHTEIAVRIPIHGTKFGAPRVSEEKTAG